jgi:hypothetical protein
LRHAPDSRSRDISAAFPVAEFEAHRQSKKRPFIEFRDPLASLIVTLPSPHLDTDRLDVALSSTPSRSNAIAISQLNGESLRK